MIILLGPDESGKSVLAQRLSTLSKLPIIHAVKETAYEDHLRTALDMRDMICDRNIWCEVAYAPTRHPGTPFQFTKKQLHNVTLLTLMRNPIIILCTRKPNEAGYSPDVLPYRNWDTCLWLYREFLEANHIPYIPLNPVASAPVLDILAANDCSNIMMDWWEPMWASGYGAIGSSRPKVLLVAERLGPNNMNNLPFETGPTGYMLSEVLHMCKTPLGDIAVTNIVKAERRSARGPNQHDLELFKTELTNLRPEGVIFMGTPARVGIPVVEELGIPHAQILHLGHIHRQGITDIANTKYAQEWLRIWNELTHSEIKEEEPAWTSTLK